MAIIDMVFTFENDEETQQAFESFDVDSALESSVESFIDEWMDENEGYTCTDSDVVEYDTDYKAPSDFNTLNEYGAYIEKCEEYGEAFILRYEDVGDHDFEDEYNGCWDSEEEFVQEMIEDCYTCDKFIENYIDWERMTRDVMMDYSSYYADGKYFIFRD